MHSSTQRYSMMIRWSSIGSRRPSLRTARQYIRKHVVRRSCDLLESETSKSFLRSGITGGLSFVGLRLFNKNLRQEEMLIVLTRSLPGNSWAPSFRQNPYSWMWVEYVTNDGPPKEVYCSNTYDMPSLSHLAKETSLLDFSSVASGSLDDTVGSRS